MLLAALLLHAPASATEDTGGDQDVSRDEEVAEAVRDKLRADHAILIYQLM